MAPGDNCVIIDPTKLASRSEVETFIRRLRKVADAIWPLQKPAKTS